MKRASLRLFVVICMLAACKSPQKQTGTSLLSTGSSASPPALLVPEVVEARQYARLSSSLYSTYDSRVLAENLVYRFYKRFEESVAAPYGSAAIDVYKDTTLMMHFRGGLSPSILARGFLNQHQTGTSKGLLDPEKRARMETILADLVLEDPYNSRYSNVVHKLRPKYTLVHVEAPENLGTYGSAKHYGDFIAVFKDVVKLRSTFTYGDSLNVWVRNGEGAYASGVRRTIQGSFYSNSMSRSPIRNEYIEAQIWGELDLKDVAFFAVPVSESASETTRQLIGTGLPVKNYSIDERHGRSFYRFDRVLSTGNVATMAALEQQLAELRQTLGIAAAEGVVSKRACISNVQSEENVAPGMVGCKTSVLHDQAEAVCQRGWHVCSLEEWLPVKRPVSAHYWLKDPLQSTGTTSNACAAVRTGGTDCSQFKNKDFNIPLGPMHVCASKRLDDFGNYCYIWDCGFENTQNAFLGGCSYTSGVLCCSDSK